MSAHQMSKEVLVRVLLPRPFQEPFDYYAPKAWDLKVGTYVLAPFGKSTLWGVVWDFPKESILEASQIKVLQDFSTAPILSEKMRAFLKWVAAYTMAPLGSVLKMVLASSEALNSWDSNKENLQKSLVPHACILNSDQEKAGKILKEAIRRQAFKTFLLEGVTGSGKTEVYFEGIQEAYLNGYQSLVLVPEISLSAQWIERFRERFGIMPTVWHSDLSKIQRRKAWRSITEGEAAVIIGARSALFLPYKNLGTIVVDEEHDQSYKQETSVIYHARDLAVMRGHEESCVVILSSATPSLETLNNCWEGKYAHLLLPERHGESLLPCVDLVDMRCITQKENASRWIAPQLQKELKTTFDSQEQALLFLNRRGYSPLLICRCCGHHIDCPNCTAWLVYHKSKNLLQCHHCNYVLPFPLNCPSCHEVNTFLPCGPGVERLAEEVEKLFPAANVLVITSDTVSSPRKVEDCMRLIQERKVDCIIGTQIMAKGHHFPFLTLVGVIDADIGLGGGDLRAAEKTYQLLYQVSGRAGRSALPGRVLVQTYTPEHPVMQAVQNYDHASFLLLETQARRLLSLPPFGKLASLIIAGKDNTLTEQFVRHMGSLVPRHEKVEVLGPAPAMIHRVHHWYRWRFLIKTSRDISPQKFVKKWMERLMIPSSIKVTIDIDPYSFF